MVYSIETDLINGKKGFESLLFTQLRIQKVFLFEFITFATTKNHLLCPLAWTSHEIYHLLFMMYT